MDNAPDRPLADDVAIRVTDLCKSYYSVDGGPTRNAALNDLIMLLRQVFGLGNPGESFQALKKLSFEVPRGAALGIIGGNGSGKSTLLKLISRVTPPTSGRIDINGRIVSLLELGFGFRDDLTGRENVLMNAAIFGVSRNEARERLDEIVEFAGIERFFDMPVRTYSSGMYLRLAFATAIHMDPDIILADEVLAVGDVRFRHKCLDKLMSLKAEGKTLLYVSHDLSEIRRVADKVLWLKDGAMQAFGDTEEVVDAFLGEMQQEAEEILPLVTWEGTTGGKPPLAVEKAALTDRKSTEVELIEFNSTYYFQLQIRTLEPNLRIHPRIDIDSTNGPAGRFAPMEATSVPVPATLFATVRLPRYVFNAGRYSARISVEVLREDRRELVTLDKPLTFSVAAPSGEKLPHLFSDPGIGAVHPLFLGQRSTWNISGIRPATSPDEEEGNGQAGSDGPTPLMVAGDGKR